MAIYGYFLFLFSALIGIIYPAVSQLELVLCLCWSPNGANGGKSSNSSVRMAITLEMVSIVAVAADAIPLEEVKAKHCREGVSDIETKPTSSRLPVLFTWD